MIMGSNSIPYLVEDFAGIIQVYSDGSVFRSTKKLDARTPPVHEESVLFRDVLFDEVHDLHLRLYRPKSPAPSKKLAVVVYLHGGGFCVGSRARPKYHNCCLRLSSGLAALVVAPDTRLAPESKIPEAVEDGASAMKWLQEQALMGGETRDAWLNSSEVDFDRVFVVGDSSGGNIAHHLAVWFGVGSSRLAPVRVRGYVMLSPFFGGVERTRSEEGPGESALTPEILDGFWRLCIPIGETKDHPLVNPFGPWSPNLEPVDLDPILCMVGGCELLRDRAQDYAEKLKALGKKIEYVELHGKQHGYFTDNPYSESAGEVLRAIENFISENFN